MAENRPHYLTGINNDNDAQPSLLHRWSQRKREVHQAERNSEETARQPAPPTSDTETKPTELPPLNDLRSESDFSGFLSPEVDEALRKAALRKLFHLSDFNVVDGLNEYDEDFTLFEALGDVVPHNLKRWQEQEQATELAHSEVELESSAGDAPVVNPESSESSQRLDAETESDVSEEESRT